MVPLPPSATNEPGPSASRCHLRLVGRAAGTPPSAGPRGTQGAGHAGPQAPRSSARHRPPSRHEKTQGEAAADYISQVTAGRAARPPPFPACARGLLGVVVEGEGRKKMASKIRVVLRPVKSIVVRFCPFESNVESTR